LILVFHVVYGAEYAVEGDVYGPSSYADETRVGPNNQPIWTIERKFASPEGTRVYVLPAWDVSLATSVDWKHSQGSVLTQEFELGLPYRFQVDYELRGDNEEEHWGFQGQSVELRYAFADWGRLPGNPALQAEYSQRLRGEEPSSAEGRLQLGDEFHEWQWGVNLAYEHATTGDVDHEAHLSAAVVHPLLDGRLSLGVEGLVKRETDDQGSRWWGQLGPTVYVKITPRLGFAATAQGGMGNAAPDIEIVGLVSYHFGLTAEAEGLTPLTERIR
jgi:hypothetical protein